MVGWSNIPILAMAGSRSLNAVFDSNVAIATSFMTLILGFMMVTSKYVWNPMIELPRHLVEASIRKS